MNYEHKLNLILGIAGSLIATFIYYGFPGWFIKLFKSESINPETTKSVSGSTQNASASITANIAKEDVITPTAKPVYIRNSDTTRILVNVPAALTPEYITSEMNKGDDIDKQFALGKRFEGQVVKWLLAFESMQFRLVKSGVNTQGIYFTLISKALNTFSRPITIMFDTDEISMINKFQGAKRGDKFWVQGKLSNVNPLHMILSGQSKSSSVLCDYVPD